MASKVVLSIAPSRVALASFILLSFPFVGCDKHAGTLDTDDKKYGYVVGVDIGRRLRNQPFDIDIESVKQGLDDSYFGNKKLLDEDSVIALALKFQKQGEKYESQMQQRREAFLKFQDSNSRRSGVVSLSNGLQYKILSGKQGANRPTEESKVSCHLRGRLLDGKILEDTYLEGTPHIFKVRHTIEGIKIGLQLMSPGMKMKLWIPSQLAYGRGKVGKAIPEYSLLVYEIELMKVF